MRDNWSLVALIEEFLMIAVRLQHLESRRNLDPTSCGVKPSFPIWIAMSGLVVAASLAKADYPTQRVLTSDTQIKAMRENPEIQDEAMGLHEKLDRYFKMTYDQLWEVVPPAGQLRAVNVAFNRGCPICGKKIFQHGGHNPWILSSDRPFKVQCPVCETLFPSNDFKPWTTARGQLEPDQSTKYFDEGT